jgi:PAS domain S-box-containing protein
MADIQLLLADEGNRRALETLVADQHTPITDETLRDADVYLVDEPSFLQYREELETHIHEQDPIFCPVVLIRREQTPITIDLPDIDTTEPPLLVNEVVTAPVEKQALFRTLSNLLARRQHTEELVADLREGNKQLREEEEKYQTLVEESEDGIAVTQAGSFVFVNERMTEIVEREREALRGQRVEAVVAPDCQELVRERHERRIAGENPPSQYEIAILTPDHERKEIDLRASRISYEGEPAVLVLFRDITERKRHEESLRRFKNAVEHAGHAIFITDVDGAIEYVNPAFEKMTGFTSAEAIGKNPRLLKSGEHDKQYYQELWDTITSGDIWTSETVNKQKSGKRFVVNQTISPIEDGGDEIHGFVAIQDEVTGRRLREQQLTVFQRILRHNLRNKGTVIKGHADLLERSITDDELTEHLDTIQANVQSLLEISEKANFVRQTLTGTRETGAERDLVEVLEQLREQVTSSQPNAEVSIDANLPQSPEIDARLVPAFQELLENAITHSGVETPTVRITASVSETTATVSFVDNGPGIPDDERHVIESGSEDPLNHGSGLGLWFVYWLVSYVGGDIDIRTDTDGTTVSVTFPLRGSE